MAVTVYVNLSIGSKWLMKFHPTTHKVEKLSAIDAYWDSGGFQKFSSWEVPRVPVNGPTSRHIQTSGSVGGKGHEVETVKCGGYRGGIGGEWRVEARFD